MVVDYPGFNMRLAKLAKAKGIPVVSYISPSAWAWHKSRAKSVAQMSIKLLPFSRLNMKFIKMRVLIPNLLGIL